VLTSRQREILEYLVEFRDRMGRTPTGPEIATRFRFKDPSPAYQHLHLMEKKGYVELVRTGQGKPLGIRLTDMAQRLFSSSWALLGTIPAGPLSEVLADESVTRIDRLDDLIPDLQPGDFFLSVSGDSMIEAGLTPGQYVVIRPEITPKYGDICAVWVEGEGSTLKQVFLEDGLVRLQPANSAYRARTYPADIVRIQGVLVAALSIEKFRRPGSR
jgi:repressor LexA